MSRQHFTEEQLLKLRQNPYVYSVTGSRLVFTKEFKELFYAAYQAGGLPRQILQDHGFDPAVIGERRIWSIPQHICSEYKKYGEFHEGYRSRQLNSPDSPPGESFSEKDQLKKLQNEVNYLKQEMEFLKKVISIRNTGK